MHLVSSRVTGFRNLQDAGIQWAPGLNLIVGPNGAGKSSLLESVAVLGTTRSYRCPDMRRVIRHGDECCRLTGDVVGPGGTVRLSFRATTTKAIDRLLLIDDCPVPSRDYLRYLPLGTLVASARDLVVGGPEHRRSFLDRLAFLLDEAVFRTLMTYRRALRQRNASLQRPGDGALGAVDAMLARAAAPVVRIRQQTTSRLEPFLDEVYAGLRESSGPDLAISYRGDGGLGTACSEEELEIQYERRYTRDRARDRALGYTVEGPHRHDLLLRADGRACRDTLSAGQTRVAAAALTVAAVKLVESQRGETVPVLVDDVDAELDDASLGRLLTVLGDGRRQLLITSAHEARIVSVVSAERTIRVAEGRWSPG